jgi:hypothetical protein
MSEEAGQELQDGMRFDPWDESKRVPIERGTAVLIAVEFFSKRHVRYVTHLRRWRRKGKITSIEFTEHGQTMWASVNEVLWRLADGKEKFAFVVTNVRPAR